MFPHSFNFIQQQLINYHSINLDEESVTQTKMLMVRNWYAALGELAPILILVLSILIMISSIILIDFIYLYRQRKILTINFRNQPNRV